MSEMQGRPADPAAAPLRGERDAMLLVKRVGLELAGLSAVVGDLQRTLGPTLSDAAARQPEILAQAQKLDLIEQSLSCLATFMSAVACRRIGRDPLDLDGFAATLTLAGLAERLSGQATQRAAGDVEMF